MEDEQARVWARSGNLAVTQLNGRAFPGVHIQGDTFAELYRQIADAVNRLRGGRDDADAWDDLDDAVNEMAGVLRFYGATLDADVRIRRPSVRPIAD